MGSVGEGVAPYPFTFFIAYLPSTESTSLVRIRLLTKVQDRDTFLSRMNISHAWIMSARLYLGKPSVRLVFLIRNGLAVSLAHRRGHFSSSSHLHPEPVLSTHEAASSFFPCLLCSWHLVITFLASVVFYNAKLRQAVCIKIPYQRHYLLHKNSGNLPHFSRRSQSGYSTIFPWNYLPATFLAHFREAL